MVTVGYFKEWKSLTIIHHVAMSAACVHVEMYFSRDFTKPRDRRIMYFMSGNSSVYITTLSNFGGHRYCNSRDVFSLLRDLAGPRDQRVL